MTSVQCLPSQGYERLGIKPPSSRQSFGDARGTTSLPRTTQALCHLVSDAASSSATSFTAGAAA
jgi:hypothetical protein